MDTPQNAYTVEMIEIPAGAKRDRSPQHIICDIRVLQVRCRMWKSFSGPGALSALCFSFCIRRCVAALQVTTNITGSEINFKERLQIRWSGGSSSSLNVGVQQQSDSGNGNFVLLSGRFRGGSSIVNENTILTCCSSQAVILEAR